MSLDNADFTPQGIELRTAGADDADLVRRVLSLAMSWRETTAPHVLADEVANYHHGWPRPDDLGIVAFLGIEFVGGAYLRRVGPADGTYGYVGDEYRELTLGVEHSQRRKGFGALCLAALQARAVERGVGGISLSVEPDNPAVSLYRKLSFELIEDRGHDLLMLWKSPRHP